jgi:hypothetical protein
VSRQRPSAQLTRRVRATQLPAGGSVPPPPRPRRPLRCCAGTAKLAAYAVTGPKLADGAVDERVLADRSVSFSKLRLDAGFPPFEKVRGRFHLSVRPFF